MRGKELVTRDEGERQEIREKRRGIRNEGQETRDKK